MFKAISWSQYIGAVLVLLLLYYAYIALVYYRAELLGLASGKGKSKNNAGGATPAPAPALGSLIGGKGALVARSAVSSPASAPEATEPGTDPAADEQPTEPTETDGEATDREHEQEPTEDLPALEELPAIDLPSVEVEEDIYDVNTIFSLPYDSKAISFTEPNAITASLPTESVSDEYDSSFTIGIAQLGDFLDRAAEGQVSQQEMVEQEPALANTDLLMSFFQSSSQSIQRATSHIYAGLAEAEVA